MLKACTTRIYKLRSGANYKIMRTMNILNESYSANVFLKNSTFTIVNCPFFGLIFKFQKGLFYILESLIFSHILMCGKKGLSDPKYTVLSLIIYYEVSFVSCMVFLTKWIISYIISGDTPFFDLKIFVTKIQSLNCEHKLNHILLKTFHM